MALSCVSFRSVFCLKNSYVYIPLTVQFRWKRKLLKRKPRWLPTAPSKVFRISQHPYTPPDEKELITDLLDEYNRKIASMRKLFQDELRRNSEDHGNIEERQRRNEKEFCLLVEENQLENERIKTIREETLNSLFQEKQLDLLQLDEERKKMDEKQKRQVEEIVRNEKEKSESYLDYECLEIAIEQAIDNPVNVNFAINLSGEIIWEDSPPKDYVEKVKKNTEHATKVM